MGFSDSVFLANKKQYMASSPYPAVNPELLAAQTARDVHSDGMVHFYLPGFFYHFGLNMTLLKLMREKPQMFREGAEVAGVYDSFPGAIWNGGRFDGAQSAILVEQDYMRFVVDSYNALGVPVRFTYTNVCLEEKHCHDAFCNLTMELADNGFNEVIVASPVLEDYLRREYPRYRYVLSTTRCIRDVAEFNEALERYDMCVLDFRENKNTEFLSKIARRDRTEILVNEQCSPDCPMRSEHYKLISQCNLERIAYTGICTHARPTGFSFRSALKEPSPTLVTAEEVYRTYAPLGFKDFKIEGRRAKSTLVAEYYAYYLAKPEYVDDVFANLLFENCHTDIERNEVRY